MSLSVYTRLTNLIAVRDVLTPAQGYIDRSCTIGQALEELSRIRGDTSLPYLVRDGGRVVGAVRYWDLRSAQEEGPTDEVDERKGAGIDEQIFPINPGQLIAADTKLWRAAHALMKDHPHELPLFVLEGDEIIGTFSFYDLFKPPFLVCLFALTVEVEQASLQLCMKDADASWAKLTKNRQEMAARSSERRHQKMAVPRDDRLMAGNEGDMAEEQERKNMARAIDAIRKRPESMLEYTCFIDKKEMILKRGLLPNKNKRWLEDVFNAAEEMRNRCAHPDSSGEPFLEEPRELLRRIQDCHELLAELKKVTEPVDGKEE